MPPAAPPPYTRQEIERWADKRRPHEREAVPVPGERLLFRRHAHGGVVDAVVDHVQDMTVLDDHWAIEGGLPGTGEPDPNVHEWHEGTRRYRRKDDPWPWVAIRLISDGPDGEEISPAIQWCKEARVRGSAGWLRPGSRAHTGDYSESGA